MNLDTKALFKIGGIRCNYLSFDEKTGTRQRLDAHLAFVTDETVKKTVREIRDYQRHDSSFDVDRANVNVRYGCAVAVVPGGQPVDRVLAPGESDSYVLDIEGEDFPLVGPGMLPLRDKIRAMEQGSGNLTIDQRHALDGIQDIFRMVSSVPDPERFPVGLVSQAYQAMIFKSGNIRLPLSDTQFVAKSRADLYRARIRQLDSSHRDAMSSARSLYNLLEDAGMKISESGIDRNIRGPIVSRITAETIRRIMQANERMCREVFGILTKTSIENLSAAMISLSGLETFRNDVTNRCLSGDWIDKVRGEAGLIARDGKSGYSFGMDIFSRDGRDIMVMLDQDGCEQGVVFVYSWPTSERIPVMEINDVYTLSVSPEEVPDEAELERLRGIIDTLELTDLHDAMSEQNQFI